MHEYYSKVGVVVAAYRIARAVAIAQQIVGSASDLAQIRDAVVRYVPLDERKTILPLLDSLVAGRLPGANEAEQAVFTIEQMNSDIKGELQ